MTIDPNFEENREHEGQEHDVDVWGPTDPPEKLGIRGTHVAVVLLALVLSVLLEVGVDGHCYVLSDRAPT